MIKRKIELDSILQRKSLFLLGPRQSGKSTLLKNKFKDALYFDLLRPQVFLDLNQNIQLFSEQVVYAVERENKKLIIIDEVQKLPILLDEVHRLIETYKDIKFILTGSSARKLRSGGYNLLGGRASLKHLYPLVSAEIGMDEFYKDLEKNLCFGCLPSIYTSSNPYEDLRDYVGLYLQEEIKAEALSRNMDLFTKFLEVVAMTNGEQINYTKIANDVQANSKTIKDYYQIIEDTLIGYKLEAYTKTKKRKAMSSFKFYLFDVGVTNSLLERRSLSLKTKDFGTILEQFIFLEIKAAIGYKNLNAKIYYWKSLSQIEVDFLIELEDKSLIAIEVKASSKPQPKGAKGILSLEEEVKLKRKILIYVSEDPNALPSLSSEKVEFVPLKKFLKELWSNLLD